LQKSGVSNMTYIEAGQKAVARILDRVGDLPLSALSGLSYEDEIPAQLYEINKYLPELFQDDSEEKYIEALRLALETSYYNGLYQFAYVQYHMLFMTAIYFALLKVAKCHKDEVDEALYYLLKDRKSEFYGEENTKNGELYFGSFAAISESDVFMLLRVIGLDDSLLGELKNFVKSRNKYAHANGRLMLTSDELFIKEIQQYNEKIEKIYGLLKPDIRQLYEATITNADFYDPEIRAYYDPDEQITQEFIKKYSLSKTELNWLRKIKTSDFKKCDGYAHIKNLHIALMHYYDLLDQDDYQPFDDPYVLYKYKNNAVEFVERELEISAVKCAQDGDTYPIYECPDCGAAQLVYDADTHRYHCFACDVDYTDEQLSECSRCGRITHVNEIGICSNCVEDAMQD